MSVENFLSFPLFGQIDFSFGSRTIVLQVTTISIEFRPKNRQFQSKGKWITLDIYLAVSYCLTVAMVSSIVLLHKVLTELTKKFKALIKVCPFLVKVLCVSALYRNSSCNSGDLWANSLKHSPSALCNKDNFPVTIWVFKKII